METDPARMVEMLVGLPDVDVIGIEEKRDATDPCPLARSETGSSSSTCGARSFAAGIIPTRSCRGASR